MFPTKPSMIAHAVLALIFTVPVIYLVYYLYRLRQFYWATEQSRRYTICPACHRVIRLVHFACEVCGQVHELIPTEKDVFYKQCTCGQRLPKVPRYGRNELTALCANHQPYLPIGTHTGTFPEVVIPIIGGTATGKSAFLAAWTVYTLGQLQFHYGVDVRNPFSGGVEYAADCVRRFQQGIPPGKTSHRNPQGIGMDIVSRTNRKGVRLYLYDPAGEVFDPLGEESENALTPFEYYDFMDGTLFMIDPFSLPMFQKTYPQSLLHKHGFEASVKRTEDSCEKFIRGLYAHNLARNEYHHASCAVVITKADAFDLDSLVGKSAVTKRRINNSSLSFEDALDEACAVQLKEWGMGRVLDLLESHFKEVRCFSVSAFGHPPESGVAFDPQRIELPVLWLINKKMPNMLVRR